VSEPTTGLDLLSLGAGILADVQAFFAGNSVTLPARCYLAPGAPGLIAWDCEQLVVALGSVRWGINEDAVQPAQETGGPSGIFQVRSAQWSVQLVRCTPTGQDETPPAPELIQAAGELAVADAGMLSQCLVNWASFPGNHSWVPLGALVKAGDVVSLGPQGGFHGFEGSFTITATGLAAPNP